MGSCIAMGIDVSKGRIDALFLNQAEEKIFGAVSFDDTDEDHRRLTEMISQMLERHPEATILAGIESTGGYELTWLHRLRKFAEAEKQAGRLKVYRLRGLDVRRFRESEPQRRSGDVASAEVIARMVLQKQAKLLPAPSLPEGDFRLCRLLRSLTRAHSAGICRLKMDLSVIHPELVSYCNHSMPNWVLQVLKNYPTSVLLAKADSATLASLPHVGKELANSLIERAKRSVAAITDTGAEFAIRLHVDYLEDLKFRIHHAQQTLVQIVKAGPRHEDLALVDSIPGIGEHTAAIIICEAGDMHRYTNVRQFVAAAGLDPRICDESGDLKGRASISKQGNAHIRAALFTCAMSAAVHNPACKALNHRLINDGKKPIVALVAVMNKLLRQIYAVCMTRKPFDPDHEAKRRDQANLQQLQRSATPITSSPQPVPPITKRSLAPVSKRETQKRKQAAAQDAETRTGSMPQDSGPGVPPSQTTQSSSFQQPPQQEGLNALPRSAAQRASTESCPGIIEKRRLIR